MKLINEKAIMSENKFVKDLLTESNGKKQRKTLKKK